MLQTTNQSERPDARAVIDFCRRSLGRENLAAIEQCVRRGWSAARNLPGILALANEFGAERDVVAAACLYLPSLDDPEQYVDVTDTDSGQTANLPDALPVFAAFALGRLQVIGVPLAAIAYTPQ